MHTGTGSLATPVSAQDHVFGPHDAPVTLVEYGDYECPYCRDAYSAIEEVMEQMGDRLRFVFRNFPLTQIHPYALDAAKAAEAAALQGKFSGMYSMIFENQDNLEPEALVSYADALGLDMEKFDKDVDSQAVAAKIRGDVESGEKSGATGTPYLFINGQPYGGPRDADSLLAALQGATG